MTANPLKKYARLLEAILSRKAEIEAELREIELTLTRMALPPETEAAPAEPRRKSKRVPNKISLGDAVFSVTKDAPLSKEEILSRVLQLGYRFSDGVGQMDKVVSVLTIDKRFEESNGKYGPMSADSQNQPPWVESGGMKTSQ